MFYTIDRYISFILNLLSITSLLITLITYIIFKELRNLPGLNLMCLAFSILTSRVRMLSISQDIVLLFFRLFSSLEKEMSWTNLDVALWLSLCILLHWPLSSGPMWWLGIFTKLLGIEQFYPILGQKDCTSPDTLLMDLAFPWLLSYFA